MNNLIRLTEHGPELVSADPWTLVLTEQAPADGGGLEPPVAGRGRRFEYQKAARQSSLTCASNDMVVACRQS